MKKRKKGRVKQFADAEVRKSETESTAGTVRKKKRVKVNQGRLILTVIVVILIAVVGMSVNDLEYIEEQARIQLRMIKPGEILFVLDKEQDKDNNDGTDQEDN